DNASLIFRRRPPGPPVLKGGPTSFPPPDMVHCPAQQSDRHFCVESSHSPPPVTVADVAPRSVFLTGPNARVMLATTSRRGSSHPSCQAIARAEPLGLAKMLFGRGCAQASVRQVLCALTRWISPIRRFRPNIECPSNSLSHA
ncbi:unnamed protein product, partial [Mycena citricolor]